MLQILLQSLLGKLQPLLGEGVAAGIVRELLSDLLPGIEVMPEAILEQQEIQGADLLAAIEESTGLQQT